ncbi:unnamed protein product [Wuchereria bancrofti]|uniref:Uncharacterized protein n=1 Tax=Wuchereria bancrofti TaxID=6293 RepID=A0A3P7EIC5_WUCBA|nr:unnamed protein product [Wuchereria bancrofti]
MNHLHIVLYGNNDNGCSKIDIQTMALNYKQTLTAELEPFMLLMLLLLDWRKMLSHFRNLESLIYEFDASDPVELVGINLFLLGKWNRRNRNDYNEQLGHMEVEVIIMPSNKLFKDNKFY